MMRSLLGVRRMAIKSISIYSVAERIVCGLSRRASADTKWILIRNCTMLDHSDCTKN